MSRREWSFDNLVGYIQQVHQGMTAKAGRAVNLSLTLRNWLIGCYIAEYELRGQDRAQYGEGLLTELAKRLTDLKVSNCNRRQLYRYIRFYRIYPEIVGTVSAQFKKLLPEEKDAVEKVGTVSPQSGKMPVNSLTRSMPLPSADPLPRISVFGIKFEERPFRSCPILRRVLAVAEIKSLYSF